MNVQGWLSGPVILAMALGLGGARHLLAQGPRPAQHMRQTSGWRPSPNSNSAGQPSVGNPQLAQGWDQPTVQTAYFQAPGNLSNGLPAFPSAATSASAQLPPTSAFGQTLPPALPSSAAAPQLPHSNQSSQAPAQPNLGNQPTNNFQYPTGAPSFSQNSQPPAYAPSPSYQQPSYQSQGAESRAGIPAQLASGELRSIQNERLPNQQETAPRAQSQPNQSMTGATRPADQTPRLIAQNITTGYPFVTPPPRGRYATSSYQPAIFQTAYQTQPVPAQMASSQMAAQAAAAPPALVTSPSVATNPYLTQQQAALPQYRYPQPGIYPTGYQCTTPAPSFPSTGAVPGAYIPPTLPPNLTPGLYTPNNAGYTPLFSLGQENYNVQLGRGIIGQPTVYVSGQPVRNFMRYLSP